MSQTNTQPEIKEVKIIPGPIEYVTLGLSTLAAAGTIYLVLDAAGVFKKKEKKEDTK